MFENMTIRNASSPKTGGMTRECRNLYNEEFHDY
jgi:hypothetical protein